MTGASAVSTNGLRFGKGHGYFDLEWAMLRYLELADDDTPVVACVHDVQLVGEEPPSLPAGHPSRLDCHPVTDPAGRQETAAARRDQLGHP